MLGKLSLAALVVAICAACSTPEKRGSVDVGEDVRKSLSRDSSKLSVTHRADGSTSVDFNGGFQHAHVVRLNDDGSLNYSCVTDADEASKFLAGGQ